MQGAPDRRADLGRLSVLSGVPLPCQPAPPGHAATAPDQQRHDENGSLRDCLRAHNETQLQAMPGYPTSMWPAHSALVDHLIIRLAGWRTTMTATEASRRFSDLLDAFEGGETITITRGNRPIAEIRPARRRTGK